MASGGGPAGPPQQRSSLKLSRAASSNLSTSDEPQPLLSRSAESLHGASAAVRRAKQEVRSRLATTGRVHVLWRHSIIYKSELLWKEQLALAGGQRGAGVQPDRLIDSSGLLCWC